MFNAGIIEAAATLDDSQYRAKLQSMPGMAKSVLGKVAGIAAGYLSFRAAVAGIKSTVGAFMVQDRAIQGVQASLRKQGQEWNLQSQDLANYAGELQKVTTYGDEVSLQAMSLGMNMGISSGQIKDATKAAMGLASAYNMDLNTAMTLIAKANAGQTGALSRYGIILDQSKDKQAQFADLLKIGADSFQLATAGANTTEGKLKQLSNAWGDLMEVIGQFIVELFGVDDAAGGITTTITDLTAYLSANLDEWVFAIRSVYYEVEAGIKYVWAILEPAITFIWQSFKAGISNIVAIFQWGFENAGKIWENLPDIFVGIGKDILQYWKNIFNGLLNLAVNLGKAIWTAIKGGGLDGFKETWDQLCSDAVKTISDSGRFTEEALAKAGVSAFPEMQSGNFGGMVDKYRNIGNEFSKIDAERAAKQAALEENYAKKLQSKREAKGGDGKKVATGPTADAAGKMNVAGSFSAAILDALIGSNTPEAETAKNTKEMVRLQRQQLAQGTGTALTYGA